MFFPKRKKERLNKELELLKLDFERITNDLRGMRDLINDEKFANQIQMHLKIYYNLSNNLYDNKKKQDEIKFQLSKAEKRKS